MSHANAAFATAGLLKALSIAGEGRTRTGGSSTAIASLLAERRPVARRAAALRVQPKLALLQAKHNCCAGYERVDVCGVSNGLVRS